jgi:hypothetical protein
MQFAAHVCDCSVRHASGDSGIFMFQLQAPTYGLAEQASSIIRAQYNGVPPPSASATLTSGITHPSTSVSGSKNEASPHASQTFFTVLAGVLAAVLAMKSF